MKIGFLINDLSSGGAERATASLANYFARHGENVEIITFKDTDSFYPIDRRVKVLCSYMLSIENSASLKRMIGAVKRMFRLRAYIKSRDLDVLIGMSFSMTWYAVFATKFTKTKSVGTERNNPYKYSATKLHTLLRKLFYRHTDGYILQTKKSAEFFSKNRSRDIIIPNAIYNELIYTMRPPLERKKIICGVGRLCNQKRFDILIDSFALIAKKIPEYNLVIYGEGEKLDELQSQVYSLGLQGRISLPGAKPDVVKYVNEASVFVLTSDLEGMPNALMEAMALGVPCVSTRCNMGPEELINDGENGLLVDVGNKKQIAQAILRILTDDELAKKLSSNSMKMRETNSIDEISRKWLKYLKEI